MNILCNELRFIYGAKEKRLSKEAFISRSTNTIFSHYFVRLTILIYYVILLESLKVHVGSFSFTALILAIHH